MVILCAIGIWKVVNDQPGGASTWITCLAKFRAIERWHRYFQADQTLYHITVGLLSAF